MTPSDLGKRLAAHGFASNADYRYPVHCALSAPVEQLRCIIVEGEAGRRKTAFANALAHSLDYDHVLYHEFTTRPETRTPVRIAPPPEEEEGMGEPPVDELDRIVSEACARSEGEPTVLILDQLQLAEFREHLRITEFIGSHHWSYADVTLKANPASLLIMLISEEVLYHSLQQLSFKLWVDSGSAPSGRLEPTMLGLAEEAREMLEALEAICDTLNVHPTLTEYRRLIHDIHAHVGGIEDLRTSIYGWIEGVDRRHLMSDYVQRVLDRHWPVIVGYLGLDERSDRGIVLQSVDE
jgi:hypothetical protein